FERRHPHPAACKRRAVMRNELGLGADDAKAAETIAKRYRNKLRNARIAAQAKRLIQRDVAGRRIDVKNASQHQLQRTSLRADDEIDALRVAREAAFELASEYQQQRDCPNTEHQQQQVQRARKTALANI